MLIYINQIITEINNRNEKELEVIYRNTERNLKAIVMNLR